MIKNIIIIILLVLVLVMAQDYFKKPTFFNNYMRNIQKITSSQSPKHTAKHLKSDASKESKKHNYIQTLLAKDKFYDAFSFYMEFDTRGNRKILEKYLTKLAEKNPTLALEYMKVFLDEVVDSHLWKVMIMTYLSEENYAQAISVIKKQIDDSSYELEKNIPLHQSPYGFKTSQWCTG